ncbi:MAG: glycosyltransferase family 4 protein [Blastocatellia bacterium]|nr:glycosyltransferase family 4 protein [Blastocatellia bacterium]
MSNLADKLVVLALDRLNGRTHTFGLLLTSLIEHLSQHVKNLTLLRHPQRADLITAATAHELLLPRWMQNHYVYSTTIALYLKRQGAHLVHYPFLFTPYDWWGVNIKRVVTIHGTSRASMNKQVVNRFNPLKLLRHRQALQAFDAIITVSHASKRDIIAHYDVPPEKVHVVYNGVGKQFHPSVDWQSTLATYGVTGPYILSVSTIKPKKNVTATLRAFARLKQEGWPHQLVLVGHQPPGYSAVDEIIREQRLQPYVIQTGFVPADEIPKFYAGATMLVFPSLHEGFGLPVVEAFASGCPVITSNVYSLPEVAGDAALYCNPEDVDDIHRQMSRVLTDSRLRQSLIEKGLARARLFSWEKAAAQLATIYAQLLEE